MRPQLGPRTSSTPVQKASLSGLSAEADRVSRHVCVISPESSFTAPQCILIATLRVSEGSLWNPIRYSLAQHPFSLRQLLRMFHSGFNQLSEGLRCFLNVKKDLCRNRAKACPLFKKNDSLMLNVPETRQPETSPEGALDLSQRDHEV